MMKRRHWESLRHFSLVPKSEVGQCEALGHITIINNNNNTCMSAWKQQQAV